MKPITRWVLIAVAGIVLLLLPTVVRELRRPNALPAPAVTAQPYAPPVVATPQLAVTPIPTPTPVRSEAVAALPTGQLRRGPVVVDLAHYSLIDRTKFQPLAAALAQHGLDLQLLAAHRRHHPTSRKSPTSPTCRPTWPSSLAMPAGSS